MQAYQRFFNFSMGAAALALLAACGGGGGGSSTAGGTTSSTASSAQLSGTAATGSALANALVTVSDTAGNSPCVEASITTSGLGTFTCTLKAGETAPFFIVVTDPSGNAAPLVSIATSTPAAGTPLQVNATPLTTAIVAQLNGGDALGVVNNKTLYTAAAFAAVKANVVAQIQSIVTTIDPTLTNYDPFTTSITAATPGNTGNTADQVLDVIKITRTASGAPALATISDPTPVAIATAATTGSSVPAPSTSVADLSHAAQIMAQAFTACYALPVSQRVTLDANQTITAVSATCQATVTQAGTPAGAPDFKGNGYPFALSFYNQLTSNLMTGAVFSVPEIMAFYPLDNSHARDRAVLNFRYLDNQGNPGNFTTVAQNFPGSSTVARASNWWLTGNQWNYDLAIKTNVRRVQDLNTAYASHFQNGLDIYINGADGTGGSNAPNSSLYDSVKVSGPGLPTLGLWYARSSVSGQFSISTLRTATAPSLSALQASFVCGACSTFWMSRTSGISGAPALALAANPTTAPSTSQWAAGTDGSYNGSANLASRPSKGFVYTFDLYKNGVAVATETRTLLTDLVPATQAVNLPWNGIGSNTGNALDIANTTLNGQRTSLALDWTQNPSAEQIKSVWVSQTDGGYDNATKIVQGATSVIATPYTSTGTTTFTALAGTVSLNAAPYSGFREIGFGYRMLDGSTKSAVYTYYQ